MKRPVTLFLSAMLLMALSWMPQPLLAEELAVLYSIRTENTDHSLAGGTLTMEVHNLSEGELHNVQLRLEDQGSIAIPGEALQLGSIQAGMVQVAVSDLFIDLETFDITKPLSWQAEYDDAQLQSKQSLITGTEVQQ